MIAVASARIRNDKRFSAELGELVPDSSASTVVFNAAFEVGLLPPRAKVGDEAIVPIIYAITVKAKTTALTVDGSEPPAALDSVGAEEEAWETFLVQESW